MDDAEKKIVDLDAVREMYDRQRQDANQIIELCFALAKAMDENKSLTAYVDKLLAEKNAPAKRNFPDLAPEKLEAEKG